MSLKALPARTALMAGIAAATALAGIANVPLSAYAAGPSLSALSAAESAPASYIILFEEAPLATYRGTIAGIAAAPRQAASGRSGKLDARAPSALAYVSYLESRQQAFLGSASNIVGRPLDVQFSYTHALNGVAVNLTAEEAARIAAMPGVSSVERSQMLRLATDAGPTWIGAPSLWNGTATGGVAGTRGAGIVVGVIDTGVNFDSPSFAATDGDGYTHVNPNGAGTYLGTCAAGGVDVGKCNAKLIGAYNFTTPPSGAPDIPGSAADADGHGSHTASTAAGNRATITTDEGASVSVSGVAPQANVIMYKTCFSPPPNFSGGTCTTTATAAAADRAVADGVDVINFSISGGNSPWSDSTSIAFRNAAAAGIFVAVAAGNTPNGDPNPAQPGTVNHHEPWTIGVAASTHDRTYAAVQLAVPGFRDVNGANSSAPAPEVVPTFATPVSGPLAIGADVRACTSFAPAPAAGFIAVIERGDCNFSVKVNNAKAAGAAAVVVYNNVGGAAAGMSVPGTTIPSLAISKEDGDALVAYLQGHPAAPATASNLSPPTFVHSPDYGDIMGSFSLIGPAGGTVNPRDLLKPDIGAPGLTILAASNTGSDYMFLQGTSMASPHVAGSGALLRALHPDWTPMEIKSALMLTAKSGTRKHTVTALADAFDTGAGRADLSRAATSPLVLDETVARMTAANPASGGDLSTLNLASLSKASCGGTCTFTRTVRNPTASSQTFSASVSASGAPAMGGTVSPASFTVAAGATQVLSITIDVTSATVGSWSFGEVKLAPAAGSPLSMPVAVRRSTAVATAPHIAVTPGSLQGSQAPGALTSHALTIANTGDAALTWNVGEQPGPASQVLLSNDTFSAPEAPLGGDVLLQVDNGLGTNVVGVGPGRQIMFLNRFTPNASDLPFTLTNVDVQFLGALNGGEQGAVIGELFDVFVYRDTDDNPANGATLLTSVLGVPVSVLDTDVQSVAIPGGLAIEGAGDVVVAVVNRGAVGGRPATGDAGPSVGRSYIGGLNVAIGTAPDLATMGLARIEQVLATFDRNFVLRARGTQGAGGACTALADVPWLSATPVSGSTAPGASSNVDVSFDSTGLVAGTYSANVCVSSNDADNPMVAVPVEMTVTPDAEDDVIFADGFETGGAATCEPLQLMQDSSFEATTEAFGSNPFWASLDGNTASDSVFCNGDCSDEGFNNARTGEFYGWFGGWGARPAYTATASQRVVIPTGSARFLNFWKFVGRVGAGDTMAVTVDGVSVYSEPATTADTDYVQKSLDLSAYADGAEHEVKFTLSHAGSAADANYFLDDVTIDCSAAPAASPARDAAQQPDTAGVFKRSKR